MTTDFPPDESSEHVVGLAGAVLDDETLHDLLHRLTLLARHTVSVSQSVSITVLDNGAYRTSNSTGPIGLAIDQAQYDDGDGPCLEALRSAGQLQATVASSHQRWPLFAEVARDAGIAGVLSTPLIPDGAGAIGALNIYAGGGGEFDATDPETAQLIGQHATILVSRTLALASSTQLNDQLRQAVATREIIGAAKGIIMESQGCTREEAFDILRRASQRENRKLREVAEELVLRVESRAGAGTGPA